MDVHSRVVMKDGPETVPYGISGHHKRSGTRRYDSNLPAQLFDGRNTTDGTVAVHDVLYKCIVERAIDSEPDLVINHIGDTEDPIAIRLLDHPTVKHLFLPSAGDRFEFTELSALHPTKACCCSGTKRNRYVSFDPYRTSQLSCPEFDTTKVFLWSHEQGRIIFLVLDKAFSLFSIRCFRESTAEPSKLCQFRRIAEHATDCWTRQPRNSDLRLLYVRITQTGSTPIVTPLFDERSDFVVVSCCTHVEEPKAEPLELKCSVTTCILPTGTREGNSLTNPRLDDHPTKSESIPDSLGVPDPLQPLPHTSTHNDPRGAFHSGILDFIRSRVPLRSGLRDLLYRSPSSLPQGIDYSAVTGAHEGSSNVTW
jgi:hypothetical protein